MSGIFISYRRADSDGWAGRLRDALRARFGKEVFQDVDNIADGEIFSDIIDRALQQCDVALVIIGPNWATARDTEGRPRLDQENDWVRTETGLVLNRKIRVIPVLVGGATLPRAEDLPEDLRSLTRRQAREIRSSSWDSDVALLTKQIKQILDERRKRPVWLYAAVPAVVVIGLGVFAAGRYFGQPVPAPAERTAAVPVPAPLPREEPSALPSKPAQASKESTSETPKEKAPEPAKLATLKPPPEPPKAAPPSRPQPAAPESKTLASVKPAPRPSAPESAQPRIASREPAPVPAGTPALPQEPRKPAAVQPDVEAPAAAPAPAAAKAAPETVARAASLNLPNRSASARDLKIGDSWTYRLREVQFNKNLATVTHEIGGGDKSGIREIVRIGGPESDAKTGGTARPGTPRRLALEARIFEQPLGTSATLFEFAPFMCAYSELQPGLAWPRIPGVTSSDSVSDWRFRGKVVGREAVRLPAGNFDAIKAELEGQLDLSSPMPRDPYSETTVSYQTYTVWFVPEIGRAVKYERRTFNRVRRLLDHEQYELVSYRLK